MPTPNTVDAANAISGLVPGARPPSQYGPMPVRAEQMGTRDRLVVGAVEVEAQHEHQPGGVRQEEHALELRHELSMTVGNR